MLFMVDQSITLHRSSYKRAVLSVPIMFDISLVSSAKHSLLQFLSVGRRSLMYRRKSMGPSTVPCGTPLTTAWGDDKTPST